VKQKIKPGQLVMVLDCEHADVPRGTMATFLHSFPGGGWVVKVTGDFKNPYDGRFSLETRTIYVKHIQP